MDLSIIIPIYNVEKYLDKCLESVYSIKNISKEVILVNDGSTDNSQDIIDKYTQKYKDETVVIIQKNKGLSGARNAGLFVAKGKYISFIDSDDYIDSNKFIKIVEECINLDLDIGFAELNYDCNNKIYQTKEIKKRMKRLSRLTISDGLDYWEKCLDKNKDLIRVEVVTNLYKNSFLKNNKLKFKEGLLHEDTLFMYEAVRKCKRSKYFSCDFYTYRTREGSIMGSMNKKNYMHRLYIASQLQEMKNNENIHLYSWDTIIMSLYFSAVKNCRIKNKDLYNLIKGNKNLTMRSKIKKIMIHLYHLSCKEVKIDTF